MLSPELETLIHDAHHEDGEHGSDEATDAVDPPVKRVLGQHRWAQFHQINWALKLKYH